MPFSIQTAAFRTARPTTSAGRPHRSSLGKAIAGTLRISLSPGAGVAPRYAPPLEAYEAFLMAQYHLQHWTVESLARSTAT